MPSPLSPRTMACFNLLSMAYVALSFASIASAFQTGAPNRNVLRIKHNHNTHYLPSSLHDTLGNIESSSPSSSLDLSSDIDFQSLMVMDVVLFRRRETTTTLELGAVQENGNVAPLSTWTLESAYTSETSDMMEFVADEEDMFPGLSSDEIEVLCVLDGSVMSYGSRQVGGGKGPGNPHGEESEMLYYVEREVVEGMYERGGGEGSEEGMAIEVVVNPNLEILW